MKHLMALVCAALVAIATTASAEYPDRPVRIINPFSAGGSGDITQRLFAQALTEQTGGSFLVENKTGAAGQIGYGSAAKSAPDGYTLVAGDATYTVLPSLYSNLPWDAKTDLVPVTVYARTPFVLVTNPTSQYKTLDELIAYAKANPGKVTFGSAGTGSINHLVMERVSRKIGVTLRHVPYKGMSDALTGLMSGSIDVIATGVPTAISHIRSSALIPLALTAEQRWPSLPDVPTFAEQGVDEITYSWFGLMAPKGTPDEIITYLRDQVVQAIADPAVKEKLDAQGLEGSGITPAEFGKMLADDTASWAKLIRDAGIATQ